MRRLTVRSSWESENISWNVLAVTNRKLAVTAKHASPRNLVGRGGASRAWMIPFLLDPEQMTGFARLEADQAGRADGDGGFDEGERRLRTLGRRSDTSVPFPTSLRMSTVPPIALTRP